MKAIISPSLLAADFLSLGKEIKKAEKSGADMLHCDVMDGVYVPNISFGFDIISKIHGITKLPLDVHMMTCCPEKYLDVLKKSGAYIVTVHSDYSDPETVTETLKNIREMGMKPAVSLKPRCPAEDVLRYLDYSDMVLVMTVEPGFGGQSFMTDMLPKIRKIREYITEKNLYCDIEVDGGIGPKTIESCAEAGANVFVVGTASFGAEDMKEAVKLMRNKADEVYKK